MKKLIILIAAIAATNAFAFGKSLNKDSSWEQINKDPSLAYNAPLSDTFGPQGVFNACATETELKSLTPIQVCLEYKTTPGSGELPPETTCVRTGMQIMTLARDYDRDECVAWTPVSESENPPECTRTEAHHYHLDTTFPIAVFERFNYGETQEALFTKDYTVPACAN